VVGFGPADAIAIANSAIENALLAEALSGLVTAGVSIVTILPNGSMATI
jgi:hypothetical protein